MVAIKAHFDGKVFVPEQPVDVPKNQSVILHVETTAERAPAEPGFSLRWMGENAIEGMPEDGSDQHDHYVHGTPKRP